MTTENCATNLQTGQTVCAAPPNCGYVDGVYNCESTTAEAPTTASANLPSAELTERRFSSEADVWEFPQLFSDFAEWLLNAMLFVPRKVFQAITEGLAAVLNSIPVPDFITQAGDMLGGIGPHVMFFAEVLQLPAGIAMVVSAYGLRFLVRRIPLIG